MSFLKERLLTRLNRRILWTLLLVLSCGYMLFGHYYKLVYCYGESMEPTYKHGELLISQRIKKEYNPKRFDVVVIKDSVERELITKRVLGLPGERLEMVQGKIYINGQLLVDPFYIAFDYEDEKIYKIPSDCVWVIGDNREESLYGIFLIREVWGLVK